MKKESQRILFFIIFGLILGSFFLFAVVRADTASEIPGNYSIFDSLRNTYEQWLAGNVGEGTAKIFFAILLTLIIYSVLNIIPIFGLNGSTNTGFGLRVAISILVSILATAYLAPQEVYAALVSYGAMGLALGGILPLVIMVFFSIEMERKTPGVGGRIINIVLWSSFIVFVIYKLLVGYKLGRMTQWEAGLYSLIIIISLVFIFGNKYIRYKLLKVETEEEAHMMDSVYNNRNADIAVAEQRLAAMQTAGAEGDKIARMQQNIDKMKRNLTKGL